MKPVKTLDDKAKELRKRNRKLYLAKYVHVNSRGKKMDFLAFPFLTDIYYALNERRRVAVMKSVQMGISEAFVVSHLEEADRGLAIQYVLPKQEIRNRFVHNRINRLTRKVPYYKKRLRDQASKVDNVVLKRFGDGVINYVDSNSESNFVEFPGDALYVDEVDQCNQPNIVMALDRLSASPYKLERYVANPKVERFGIHNYFMQGSQGRWWNKCDACGRWQQIDFFTHVVRQTAPGEWKLIDTKYDVESGRELLIRCEKCGKTLDRYGQAEWVHEREHDFQTFSIGKIHSPFSSVADLWRKFDDARANETKMTLFYNSDLGIPYTAVGSKITEQMLDQTRVNGWMLPPKWTEGGVVYAGIDVGAVCNVVIRLLRTVGGRTERVALFIGTIKDEDDIIAVLRRYSVKVAVMDALPEIRLVERMKAKFSGLWSCHFKPVKVAAVDKKNRDVAYRRTVLLDTLFEQFKAGEIHNPQGLKDVESYYTQLQSNTRVLNERRLEYDWMQSSDPDHYHLAEAYGVIAADLAAGSDVFAFYEQTAAPVETTIVPGVVTDIPPGISPQDFLSRLGGRG